MTAQAISTHSPLRGETASPAKSGATAIFQPTPLCEGRQYHELQIAADDVFQPTPLCEGRQSPRFHYEPDAVISTHSPLRGETSLPHSHLQQVQISTHSPLRGETSSSLNSLIRVYFNPLPSARGDGSLRQSSHGASFQPTPLCEGRPQILMNFTVKTIHLCENSTVNAKNNVHFSQNNNPKMYKRGLAEVCERHCIFMCDIPSHCKIPIP